MYKYKFENKVKAIVEYYKKFGKYPSKEIKDLKIKRLAQFLAAEKNKMRDENNVYPEWKKEILEKYLPDFSCETRSEKSFNEFIYYAKMYKERYGHVNIKFRDTIGDGYNIGSKMNSLKHCKLLSEIQIKDLEKLGVHLGNNNDKQFNDTIELAKQAIKDGKIISRTNSKYKDKDLYGWVRGTVKKKFNNNKLSLEEIQIIEKLVGKSLGDLYCGKESVKVKVIDIIENKVIGIFESQKKTSKVMREKYDIKINSDTIRNHLTGKRTIPYKGRFMFYYADENEEATE